MILNGEICLNGIHKYVICNNSKCFLFKQFCFCHFVFYVKWSHESMMTTVGCLFWKQQKWILKKKSFCANTKTVSNVFRSIESSSLDIVPKVFLSIGLAKRAFFPLFSARYKTNVCIAILFWKTLINKQKMKKKCPSIAKKKLRMSQHRASER